jgi:hypothetical protein
MRPILKTLGLAILLAGALNPNYLPAQNPAITNAEAEKFSLQLESSVNSGNPDILNHLIYFPAFLQKTKSRSHLIDNVDTLTKIADDFGLFRIGNNIVEVSKNGSYQLVRGFVKNDEMHVLFRAFGDGGLEYQDITLIKVKDTFRAADILSYHSGESYAQLFAYRIADAEIPDAHKSMSSREKYGKIFDDAINHQNYSAARSAFEKFDDETQNDRHLSLQYMQACQHLSEKVFRKSVDRFTALYPNEPTPWLLQVEQYADSRDVDTYGTALDKLDTLLGIDPFLNYFRGNVEMKLGNMRAGMHFYEEVFHYDPGIWQNTQKLVACKVVNNELVQASEAINLYTRTPGYKKELVESLYADYPALK